MRRRTTAAVAATTLLATGAATAVAGRWAMGATLATSARAPRPPGFAQARVTVHAVTPDRVTLTRCLDTLRPGRYGLVAGTVHQAAQQRPGTAFAVVGAVMAGEHDPDTVVRRLYRVPRGALTPGTEVTLTPQLHVGDPGAALGIGHREIAIPGDQGPLPAWFVPGPRDTWVIALHGLGATREHPLNLLPFLHQQRLPTLLPSYRGDPGAPRPRSGLSTLGATEWHDADAALRYAVRNGARAVVLYGWSTGGAMALYLAAHSPLRGRVSGIVLDSPVLDPTATARALATQHGVPGPLTLLAVAGARALVGAEDGAGPAGTGAWEHPAGPRGTPLPVLLLHGPHDIVAPFEASRALAARHPENVVLHTVPHAQHAAVWNADPEGCEERLRRFLTPLM